MIKNPEWALDVLKSYEVSEELTKKTNKELADLLEKSDFYQNTELLSPLSDLLMEIIDRLRK